MTHNRRAAWFVLALAVAGLAAIYLYPGRQSRKVYHREAFVAEAVRVTAEGIRRGLGEPDRIDGDRWYYRGRTYDPATGRRDALVELVFAGGSVAEVNFR